MMSNVSISKDMKRCFFGYTYMFSWNRVEVLGYTLSISQNLSTQPNMSAGVSICGAPSDLDGCFVDELAGLSILVKCGS